MTSGNYYSANIQNINISQDLLRTPLNELGKIGPYYRYVNFPPQEEALSKFSKQTILKAFPHREAVLWNLDVAIEVSLDRDSLKDTDRLDFLCDCHAALQHKEVKKAVELAERAGYSLMAAAISHHWVEKCT